MFTVNIPRTALASVVAVVRPHRPYYTYLDAVYSYQPSSVVCRSVGLSVTLASPAKTAEPIEMPFGLRTWVGPGNHALYGVQIIHGKGQFRGGKGRPIVVCAKTAEPIEVPCRL